MAWVKKGKQRYFYRSRRVGHRVVRDYFGKGAIAEMAAHLMNQLRLARETHDQRADRLDEADAQFRQLHAQLDRAAAAHLLAAGFHRHDRGPWRRKRRDD